MMISDLNISMVFKDHSILQRKDYYFLIMDYNHDIDFFFFNFLFDAWLMIQGEAHYRRRGPYGGELPLA